MTTENRSDADTQKTARQTPKVSQLQRREFQAPIAACLIRGFSEALGEDQAVKIATAAIQSDARRAGETTAAKLSGNSMKELGAVVKEIWAADDAITIQILEETDQTLCFNVTRCRYAEFYQKEGMLDLGYCLSCSRDEAFARGFNPRIRLIRTQTIMQGNPVCDFRFVLEETLTTE